jgi:hypothetical protein
MKAHMNNSCPYSPAKKKKNALFQWHRIYQGHILLTNVMKLFRIHFSDTGKKKRECNKAVHQLFTDLKKAHDPVRREVLYKILLEIDTPLKLVRRIKMCLNETYSKVRIGKHLFEVFLSKLV